MQPTKLRLAGENSRPLPKAINFTEAALLKLNCPPEKARVRIYDRQVKGLTYRITASDGRSFYWYGKPKGSLRPVDYHIGDAGKLTLADARATAHEINSQAAKGINPQAGRQEKKELQRRAITVGQLWDSYRDQHLKPKARASTYVTEANRYKNHLSAWASKPVPTITREDVAAFHSELTTSKTPSTADKTIKLLRAMLTWARVSPNPAADGAVTFHGDEQRQVFLTQTQIATLLAELDNAENRTVADAIRFALMTGARKGNVRTALWADIHLNAGMWIIPADQSKNARPMTIALAPLAVKLLRVRLAGNHDQSLYVFPGAKPGTPIQDVKHVWTAVRKAAGIPDVTFHDLRHTLASHMVMQGTSLPMVGKQLGHANQQSTARYAHLEVAAVKPATEAATAAMFASPAKRIKRKRRPTKQRPA